MKTDSRRGGRRAGVREGEGEPGVGGDPPGTVEAAEAGRDGALPPVVRSYARASPSRIHRGRLAGAVVPPRRRRSLLLLPLRRCRSP